MPRARQAARRTCTSRRSETRAALIAPSLSEVAVEVSQGAGVVHCNSPGKSARADGPGWQATKRALHAAAHSEYSEDRLALISRVVECIWLPNGVRLSCGAELEHARTQFYYTALGRKPRL